MIFHFLVSTQLQSVNPLLLEFMKSITTTVRERKHPSLASESANSKHIKDIRIYFALCLLQYCTNPSQPIPFHNLISDAVEVCGGSRQLLQILNRLGCTSSPDTHDRFVTYHAEAKRKRHIWDKLPQNVFTVASVDNFDMLQSYSAVYCGDQQRSYHGTTVQLVQPNCNLVLRNIDTIATLPSTVSSEITTTHVHNVHHEQTHDQLGSPSDDNTNLSAENFQTETSNSRAVQVQRMHQFSPDSSPHKLGKVGPK